MKALILILTSFLLSSCAIQATRHGDFMQLKGWGAKSANWEDADGSKYSINKEEPLRVPDLVPLRSN